jgi:predicted ribosome quality control (RQC) complex YloA/Tae2 family protein
MREITALELAALVNELRQKLPGLYIEKFYELGENQFRIRLSKRGSQPEDLMIDLTRALNLTQYMEKGDNPSNFSIAVRKFVTGFAIDDIEQHGIDRVVSIGMHKGETGVKLILEMFGKGNLVIVDSSMKILLAYKVHDFKDRKVRTGEQYINPKGTATAVRGSTVERKAVESQIASPADAKQTIQQVLSRSLGIGTVYVEEALASSGVDPKAQASDVPKAELEKVLGHVERILGYIAKPEPVIYRDQSGKAADYSLYKMGKAHEGMTVEEHQSIQEVLDTISHEERSSGAASVKSAKEQELESSIAKQESILREMDSHIEANKAAGEVIFKNMNTVNKLIEYAKNNRKSTKEELKKMFPGLVIDDVDLKEKTITVELQ